MKQRSLQYLRSGIASLAAKPLHALSSFHNSFLHYPNVYSTWYIRSICEQLGCATDRNGSIYDLLNEEVSINILYKINIIDDLLKKSVDFMRDGLLNRSLESLESILHQYPRHTEALFTKAVILQNTGCIEQAAVVYNQALNANPISIKCLLNLASLYQQYGDCNSAIDLYKSGIQLSTFYQQVIGNAGKAFYQLPFIRYYIDIHVNNTIIALHPDYIKMNTNLGLAYYQNSMLTDAISQTKALLKELEHFKQVAVDINAALNGYDIDQDIFSCLSNLLVIYRSALNWRTWEETTQRVVRYTLQRSQNGMCLTHHFNLPLF